MWKNNRSYVTFMTYVNIIMAVLSTPDIIQEYCHDETFQAKCDKNSVIVMEEAKYGRMRIGPCFDTDFGFLGCSNNVLEVMDKECAGHRRCNFDVRELEVAVPVPCHKSLKSSLDAKYKCIKVATSDDNGECCRTKRYARLSGRSGSIASIVSEETDCGSEDCPWVVEADPGQMIHLTLLDFGTLVYEESKGTSRDLSHKCYTYLIIKEKGTTMTVCAEGNRKKRIYTSTTNKLEIKVVKEKRFNIKSQFLLKYSVSGCDDPLVPSGAKLDRKGDQAILECTTNKGLSKWVLTCEQGKWAGDAPICQYHGSKQKALTATGMLNQVTGLNPGILAVILICIISPILASIAVCGGLCWMNRKPRQPKNPPPVLPRNSQQGTPREDPNRRPVLPPKRNQNNTESAPYENVQVEQGTMHSQNSSLGRNSINRDSLLYRDTLNRNMRQSSPFYNSLTSNGAPQGQFTGRTGPVDPMSDSMISTDSYLEPMGGPMYSMVSSVRSSVQYYDIDPNAPNSPHSDPNTLVKSVNSGEDPTNNGQNTT